MFKNNILGLVLICTTITVHANGNAQENDVVGGVEFKVVNSEGSNIAHWKYEGIPNSVMIEGRKLIDVSVQGSKIKKLSDDESKYKDLTFSGTGMTESGDFVTFYLENGEKRCYFGLNKTSTDKVDDKCTMIDMDAGK
jgi:hypothetical protein